MTAWIGWEKRTQADSCQITSYNWGENLGTGYSKSGTENIIFRPFEIEADIEVEFELHLDFDDGAEDGFPRDWSLVAWGEDGEITVRHENPKFRSNALPHIPRISP